MASIYQTLSSVRCAGQAPRSPVLAQHVVLPVLHILLDAMGADAAPQGTERSQRSRSAMSLGSSQPAASPGPATPAAGGGRSPSQSPDVGAVPSDSVPRDVSLAQSDRGGSGRAAQQVAQRPQVLVSFSDFMSGRAGLADYLARRATGAVADSRPADGRDDSRARRLMMKCVHCIRCSHVERGIASREGQQSPAGLHMPSIAAPAKCHVETHPAVIDPVGQPFRLMVALCVPSAGLHDGGSKW